VSEVASVFCVNPRRYWNAIAAAVASGLAAYGILFAAKFWRVLPFWDEWEAVAFYRTWTSTGFSFSALVAQHNEHRLPFVRLAFLLDFSFFQGRSIFIHSLLLLLHIGLGTALGLVASQGLRKSDRALCITAAVAFFVAPVQLENLTLPFHLQWAGCGLFALGSFFWTAQLADPLRRDFRSVILALAATTTVLAVYSSANGLAAAAIVAAVAAAQSIHLKARLVLVFTAAAAIVSYFIGYEIVMGNAGFHAALNSRTGIGQFVAYVAVFLGSVGQFLGLKGSALLGTTGLLIWGAVIVIYLRFRSEGRFDPNTLALLMLSFLAIATAAMTAFGRAGTGPAQALSSRYTTWSIVFWVSLGGSAWRLAEGFRHASRIRTILFLGSSLLLMLSYLSGQRVTEAVKARTAIVDTVTAELRQGQVVSEHLAGVYPQPAAILPYVELMRERRLSIFAD